MTTYYVRGTTAATVATIDHAIAAIWNPSATRRIRVWEYSLWKTTAGTAGDSAELVRITARGTPGSTVTPDASNSAEDDAVPPSGALLDLAAYSVQPTLAAPRMLGWVAAAVAGSGILRPLPRGISIPPGTGLALVQRTATIWPVSEVDLTFED